MSLETPGESTVSIAGRPVDEAVEALLAEDGSRDRSAVRAAVEAVAEDGTVSTDGAESELAHVSKVVSTAETRTELAALSLSDAREAASGRGVEMVDVVQSRIEAYEAELSALEEALADLGSTLQDLLDRADDPGALYAVGRGVRRLDGDAKRVQRAADELNAEIENFEQWVRHHEVRVEQLREDLAVVEESLDDLAGTADDLQCAPDDERAGPTWVDATMRHRVLGLMLDDLRVELDRIRSWPGRDGNPGGERDAWATEVEGRIDDLAARRTTVGERLDDVARTEWADRHEDRLSAFESALDEFEPPVPWGEIQTVLEERRPATRGDA